ncbi:MAG: hypothetical protein ACI9S8_000084 [Chlamydiales bacterium]|jgi:hypothetical protein
MQQRHMKLRTLAPMDKQIKLGIWQPYFFPYIGYFQLIQAVDLFVLYDDVTFRKRSWINRNRILVNASPNFFSIPLIDLSQNRLINESFVVEDSHWKKKFLKKLEGQYRKAPQFQDVFEIVSYVLSQDHETIVGYALSSIRSIMIYLEISTELKVSSESYKNTHLSASERILDICQKEQADEYINPINGQELYSKKEFLSNQISLNFLKTRDFFYQQYLNDFVPNLSVIDLIMFNDKKKSIDLLKEYDLV